MFRFALRRVVSSCPGASRRLRLAVLGGVGISLVFAFAAGAGIGGRASADVLGAETAWSSPDPLSVSRTSLRELDGRLVGTATIVNTGKAPVRSTTGLLGVSRGSSANATGLLTFRIPALAPQRSRSVRFTTGPLRALPVASRSYKILVCTDIYGQIRRFAPNANCSARGNLAITTASRPKASGAVPNTIIRTSVAGVTENATRVFRFVSTVTRSAFQCRLDRAPWLACSSPQRYVALAGGRHIFDVRAISPAGHPDPTPARASWTVDARLSDTMLTSPGSGGGTEHNESPPAIGTAASPAPGSGRTAGTKPTTATATPSPSPSASSYSIGGAVTGLSGTVVLQDNGGDDLSLRSNGPFAFATPLPDGAAYRVTVKSSPAGQACTVSGPAGSVASANVSTIAVTCAASAQTPMPGADAFNRPDGSLGADWTPVVDGGLAIASQALAGHAGSIAGAIRVRESYGSDQRSQIAMTSAPLAVGDWVGPAVRVQNGGQDGYLGLYWNDQGTGRYELQLYVRKAGGWRQLGSTYTLGGPLPAGTQLTLNAVGSRISLQQNGTERIIVTDATLTGGAPGVMTYGAATADDWAGGTASAPPPPPTYTIGGTVSGLSGTAVLQDNGGDDLSLSSDGAFRFATPVPAGGAYRVSIKSSPSDQTCTVSNAAGAVASANVSNVAVTCATSQPTSTPGADSFDRVDGGLGADWVAMSDGAPSIRSREVVGNAGAQAGEIRAAETYASDQYARIDVTSTQLSGGQWIGPTVRSQNGGQDTYLGIYFWNNGDPQLRLYKRTAGTWIQLGDSYESGPLPAGTQLTLSAVGSTISFRQNGIVRISATDSTLSGGAPGLMTFGDGTADNWAGGNGAAPPPLPTHSIGGTVSGLSGTVVLQNNDGDDLSLSGNGAFTFSTPIPSGVAYNVTVKTEPSGQTCTTSDARGTVASANIADVAVTCTAAGPLSPPSSMQVQYAGTDSNGVASYNFTSADNGYGTHVLRVLSPTHPTPGVPHNFLYVLPVEPEGATSYGDAIETLRDLDAQDQYNLTIIEPSFAVGAWIANHPTDPSLQYETFYTQDLVPWVTQHLAVTGNEQNWLIGFSRSGLGAQDLILKHPDTFAVAASWDFPGPDMDSYTLYGAGDNYGTDANFQANYRLSPLFVAIHETPFLTHNRIWIGGYSAFQTDLADYDALLSADGVLHTTEPPQQMQHTWDGGWVPAALSALSQDSAALPAGL